MSRAAPPWGMRSAGGGCGVRHGCQHPGIGRGCRMLLGAEEECEGTETTRPALGGPCWTIHRTCPVSRDLVGATGFEPATFSSRTRRATKLRYAPFWWGEFYRKNENAQGVSRNRKARTGRAFLFDSPICIGISGVWSERLDSNQRPSRPERDALPSCATLRFGGANSTEKLRVHKGLGEKYLKFPDPWRCCLAKRCSPPRWCIKPINGFFPNHAVEPP